MITIEMLPANEGDSLWIEYGPAGGPVKRILIDCGRSSAYAAVRERLDEAAAADAEVAFELFVLTHVDEDHIFGSVKLMGDPSFQPERVGDVWFNGWGHLQGKRVPPLPPDQLGAQQGEYFGALLQSRRFSWNKTFDHEQIAVPDAGPLPTVTLPGGMKLTILSPSRDRIDAMRDDWQDQLDEYAEDADKHIEAGDWERALEVLAGEARLQPDALGHDWVEDWDADAFTEYAGAPLDEDTKAPNGSSIAFVAEYENKRVLLTGDAHPSVLAAGLRRYRAQNGIAGRIALDAFKLSHHGSKNNISDDLLGLISCKRWLVSSNGARHHHPNPETIARVIAAGARGHVYFNYRSTKTEVWDDDELRDRHKYATSYGKNGRLVVEV